MNDKYISFCHNGVMTVPDQIKTEVLNRLKKINLHNRTYKKCTDLNEIDETYLITNELDKSKRHLLFLVNMFNTNYTIFIDISDFYDFKCYSLNLRFDSKLYHDCGTLFEGDLVYNEKKCWLFLISNIYYHISKNVSNYAFGLKLQIISGILKSSYTYDDFMNPFFIQLRSFYLLNHLELVDKDTKLLFFSDNPHKSILILDLKMDENTTEKHDKEYTVRKGKYPDLYKMYDDDKFVSILSIKKLSDSKKMTEMFKDKTEHIVKCYFENNMWHI